MTASKTAAKSPQDASQKDRLPPLPPETWNDEQKAAAGEFQSGRGYAVSGPFAVMLR